MSIINHVFECKSKDADINLKLLTKSLYHLTSTPQSSCFIPDKEAPITSELQKQLDHSTPAEVIDGKAVSV